MIAQRPQATAGGASSTPLRGDGRPAPPLSPRAPAEPGPVDCKICDENPDPIVQKTSVPPPEKRGHASLPHGVLVSREKDHLLSGAPLGSAIMRPGTQISGPRGAQGREAASTTSAAITRCRGHDPCARQAVTDQFVLKPAPGRTLGGRRRKSDARIATS